MLSKIPRSLWIAALLMVLVILAACAPAPTPVPTAAPPTAAPKPTTAPVATSAPAPTTAPTAAPTKAPQRLLIGYTASQTGAQQVSSQKQTEGLQLWLDDIKKAGGIKLKNGTVYMPEAKFYDDESKADRVTTLYTKLINEDKADFLLSPYSSGLARNAISIAEQNGKVMITAGAAEDLPMEGSTKKTFQLYTPGSQYYLGVTDLLAKLDPSIKKIAFVYENEAFTLSVMNAFIPYAKSKGYEAVVDEKYDSSNTDFSAFINKVSAASPDAIIGGGHNTDSTSFGKQLFEKKVTAKLVALLVAPPEPTFATLGDAALYVVGPTQWEPVMTFDADVAKKANLPFYGPDSKTFTAAYKAKYNADPSYHSAGGYAQGLILQKAIEDADSVDPDKVVAALEKVNVMTFYGVVKFSTDAKTHGKQIGHAMVLMQWQKDAAGKLVKQVVWPFDSKSADVQIRK
ncbi:MAG: amino acid ABC transporter substrate-binding protein [Chloroflexota bacterium]|nr:amino acid ABC transporter substrate-binding protein [Chloroflexota bacterium]